MEKRKPTYDLVAFRDVFNDVAKMNVTAVAIFSAARAGFGRADIVATMQRGHFYKSMTSHADHRVWQDVYHVPSRAGILYVKFTADAVTEFNLLSFKEKNNG